MTRNFSTLTKEHAYANTAIIRALNEAKGLGLCSYIGLSFNRSAALAHVLRRVELDMCLSAGEYSLLNHRSSQMVQPVVREQRIAYVVGGIFAKQDLGVPNEPSPFQLARKGPLAQTGAIFSDERLIKFAKDTGISIAALTVRFLIANRGLRLSWWGHPHPGKSRRASWLRRQVRYRPIFIRPLKSCMR